MKWRKVGEFYPRATWWAEGHGSTRVDINPWRLVHKLRDGGARGVPRCDGGASGVALISTRSDVPCKVLGGRVYEIPGIPFSYEALVPYDGTHETVWSGETTNGGDDPLPLVVVLVVVVCGGEGESAERGEGHFDRGGRREETGRDGEGE